MQKILVISLITLFGLGLSFSPPVEATGAFPSVMILKGQLTINGSNVPAGTKVEAYSQNGNATNLLDSTTNTREGWYGGNNADTKLTFGEFSGTLFFKVTPAEGQAITVKSTEITKDSSSPINCPTANNITFLKDGVCQYNIAIGANSTPPAKPELKGYATSATSITLSWAQSPDANWQNYTIYRGTDSSDLSILQTITNKTTTTHTDSNLSSNTTYYYKISTNNNANGSTASEIISVLTQGSSTNTTPYTLPTTSSTIPLFLTRPLKLQNLTDANTLPRPVELLDTSGKHTALIPKQTRITTANGSNFTGTLNPPQAITVSTSLKPAGLTVLKAIKVGFDDQKINFSKAVELTIDLTGLDLTKTYKVYYYDTDARKYKLAGNGGQVSPDNKTIKVLVTHFTTFVVLEATANEINLASSGNNNTSSGSGSGGSGSGGSGSGGSGSGSSSSSGGGSGPGSSSTNTTPYTLPTTPSSTVLTLTRPVKLQQTQGKLPRPLKLADPNRKTSTVIPKDTQVTTKTGQKFTGQLNPPKIISSTIVAQPANRLPILTAIQVGLTTQTLNFSQPVELTLPLPGLKFDRTKVKVYYYDPATRKYKLAGNGGQVATDNKTIKVLVSHFTTFVALESAATEIATSSPSTPTSTLPTPQYPQPHRPKTGSLVLSLCPRSPDT